MTDLARQLDTRRPQRALTDSQVTGPLTATCGLSALAMVLGAAEHGARDMHSWQSGEGRYWASYGVPLAARYLA